MFFKLSVVLVVAALLGCEATRFPLTKVKGSKNLKDDIDFYAAKLSIGTPAQDFTVVLDLSISNLWVPSVHCTTDVTCDHKQRYDHDASSSYVNGNKTFQINYESNQIVGNIVQDNVEVSGVTAKDQQFGEATRVDSFVFSYIAADGALGLGYPSKAVKNISPLVNNLYAQGAIKNPTFAFKPSGEKVEFILGETNSEDFKGDLVYLPITEKDTWKVEFDGFTAGSFESEDKFQALLSNSDTISGPSRVVLSIYHGVGGQGPTHGVMDFNCSAIDSYSNIDFNFGGKTITLTPQQYIYDDGEVCGFRLERDHNSQNDWTFGIQFFTKYYTEFDFGKNRVGFADVA